mmetsp:Transcript_37702/g.52223  ORF Transcript_37702/g.52223 Transcript_37702/m.52223 type:complete len:474 (-) Transcript_37702:65-1486(-)|eukprot:CAMPEP_0201485100 /NCGR_PEP_ID=MMETSP0151_2-20130828/9238_1 /ASSEMBLY_ACC=CAM_ASM_000257 /TAXON_ID=200890 /ORGANISM="Paramoeba atlantica, Strain 621/1 / CCAP 1560/9" /LENGTH=473 /DNA_ID=CAMNT_0047869079 /DNA_START=136 /DNA_END=1557 /DNA_ORIENTATION=+
MKNRSIFFFIFQVSFIIIAIQTVLGEAIYDDNDNNNNNKKNENENYNDGERTSDQFGNNPQHEFGSVVVNQHGNHHENPLLLSPLPFWRLFGDAQVNEHLVRLTSNDPSQKGGIWSRLPIQWGSSWEILVQFNIHGENLYGADGMGIWLAEDPLLGDFFGYVEDFVGIGVIIDTYDNDGSGNHPVVSLVSNDGTKKFSHSHGSKPSSDMERGHCSVQLRNQDSNMQLKLHYSQSTLSVSLKRTEESRWRVCFSDDKFFSSFSVLHLGLTALTGSLSDYHDVFGLSFENLDSKRSPSSLSYDESLLSKSEFALRGQYEVVGGLGRLEAQILGYTYSQKTTQDETDELRDEIKKISEAAVSVGKIWESLKIAQENQALAYLADETEKELKRGKDFLESITDDVTQSRNNFASTVQTLYSNFEQLEQIATKRRRQKKASSITEKGWNAAYSILLQSLFFLGLIGLVCGVMIYFFFS